jgi:hypothetical protein
MLIRACGPKALMGFDCRKLIDFGFGHANIDGGEPDTRY